MTKISFELWDMTLMDPMGLITNWLLTAQACYYFVLLKKTGVSKFDWYWSIFFLILGISTFFGGLSHLLYHYTGMIGKAPGWSLAALAVTCVELGVASELTETKSKYLQYFSFIKLIAVYFLLTVDLHFRWTLLQSATGLLVILGTWSSIELRKGNKHLVFFLFGIGSLLLALPFRIFEYDIHTWFNRNDTGHILMMCGLLLFMQGVKKSQKAVAPASSSYQSTSDNGPLLPTSSGA